MDDASADASAGGKYMGVRVVEVCVSQPSVALTEGEKRCLVATFLGT